MACISSVYPPPLRPGDGCFTSFKGILESKSKFSEPCDRFYYIPHFPSGAGKYRTQSALCKQRLHHEAEQTPVNRFCILEQHQSKAKRRQLLFQLAFTALSFPAIVSNALAEDDVTSDFRIYTDDANRFKIMIPQDWQVGAGEPNGFKSITAFYPEETSTSNVSVVITGLGPDFTRMESFGKVEAFADTLVSGLDRSWQRPPGVTAKLIDCKASNGFYYIQYTLQNPGESRKHLFSAIGMASNGWYNRLYTVTGQFEEEESEKFSSRIEKAVESFRFIRENYKPAASE